MRVLATLALASALCAASTAHAENCYASHYGWGDGYHGKRTASGERMNASAMTAAHKRLPFGTWVRVSGRAGTANYRINDRGPFKKGRCIDIASGTMRHVCGTAGTCRVTVNRI